MIKLLAVDMDGTCLDGRSRMSAENLAALRRAAEAGILVVPTTGRSLSCLPYRLRSEKFFRYVISSNGAQVTDLYTGEDLFQTLIPKRRAMRLVQLAQSLPVDYTYMDWDGGHEWAFWDRSLVYAIDRFVNPGYADQILKGWSSEAFTTERG